MTMGEHIDLAGDIEVMRADRKASFEHWCRGRRERTCAMQDELDAIEFQAHRRRVGQIENAMLQSKFLRELGDCYATTSEYGR